MISTISLNIIMKNEAKVLPRLLESVYPILDYYVVVDTGSTDDSKKIIKDFFDSKGISGEIFDHPFVNFQDARNFALSKVKGKADFGFWIDCDEQLILPSGFDVNAFKETLSNYDKCNATVSYNDSRYGRGSFFRTSKPYYWRGAVHEVMMCHEPTVDYNANEIVILVKPDGNSWEGDLTKKYLTHAKMLEREVMKTNDPRDVFYLAQSYRDAGENKKSADWYRKRASRDDGYYEEKFFAQYQLANLSDTLNRPTESTIYEYIKSHEYDIMRGENLLKLISFLQKNNLWNTAYIFSKFAVETYHGKNPYYNPQHPRALFLDSGTYDYKILEAHKVNCQRTGRGDFYFQDDLAKMSFDELMDSIPSAWKGHKEFASWLVDYLSPKVTVELGVDYGYSLFCVSNKNKGIVYGIDSFEGDPFTGIRNTKERVLKYCEVMSSIHGINNVKILNKKFNDTSDFVSGEIDLLHIDGNPMEIENDFNTWFPLVSANGVAILHNTQSWDHVKNFFAKIEFPKIEFTHSGGLGIVSMDKSIIEKIKNKYFFESVPITIGYIRHNQEVFNKYLSPSLNNLVGEFEVVSTTDELKPAQNYNSMIDIAKNSYILLVHEDVTFSPDLLHCIHSTIRNYPKFGAIGAVGIGRNGKYYWGDANVTYDVEKLDCCCILINKEHSIRFDEKTFDDFHLYVEDYCMNVIKNLGLSCHTILTNASEADKGIGYEAGNTYFKHHSHTVGERGYCWGRYYEYLNKLEDKYKNVPDFVHAGLTGAKGFTSTQHNVDVCIISYAKTKELEEVTRRGIKSLLNSESGDNAIGIYFNVFVVESNKNISYDDMGYGIKTIYTNEPFGYHKYLNIAIAQGHSEYVLLANNDLTFEKGWASEIIKNMIIDPKILSASPFCPQTQNESLKQTSVRIGYQVRQELAGWAIFVQRKIFTIMGMLPEDCTYWYSDNDYSMTLQKHGIKHALVTNSVVNHHDGNHGSTGKDVLKDDKLMNEYTNGQYEIFKKKWSL